MSLHDNPIVFILWVAGSGKSTIMKHLLEKKPIIKYIPSFTTRKMREWEQEGDPYFFLTDEEFKRRAQEGYFIEYMLVHGRAWYGTGRQALIAPLLEWLIPIKELDMQGLRAIMDKQTLDIPCIALFLDVPEDIMRQRMCQRQPDMNEEELSARCSSAQFEREAAKKYCNRTIDATLPLENVVDLVIKYIDTAKNS
jgi:guanylate kinase